MDHSYKILNRIDKACKDSLKAAEGRRGTILISYASGVNVVLMRILLLFREKFPDVEIIFKQSLSVDIIEDLQEGRIHIGVLPPFENKLIHFQTISISPNGVILPLTHSLAGDTTPLKVKELEDEPFVVSSRTSLFFDHIQYICNQSSFSPKIVQEVLGLPTIISCVASGMGVSIVSKLTMQQHPNPKIVFRELRPITELKTALAWRKDEKSPSVHNFLSFAKEYLDKNNLP
ncbi:LysR family substrate-binding domain-containing protein [Bacillus dakarensis]|uniref:LysR family substrate-binding domain-containing protein n=1 Tax=Robertmurraya dakarensis TaxID=1926278 RepID=UPI00137A93FC|nr:LysR family substrate-binding domain-containing protein [Bacillus dakarensis]